MLALSLKSLVSGMLAFLAALVLVTGSNYAQGEAGQAGQADFALSNGWFYSQASGQPGRGFAVTDEAGVQFWSEFRRLGGVSGVGYPISQRFVWDGFVSQAFQKMVFQWRPEVGRIYAINVIDLMHERGLDGWLQVVRANPPIADWSSDRGRSWPQIVAAHQALLTDPEIRETYFAVDDPVTLYGLPMAPIQNMGNVLVLRMQRGIIQKWLVDVPWARAGQVTVANSGDVAKEAGLLPTGALTPSGPGAPPTSHGGPVRDYVSLIDNLRAAGATVEPVGEVRQPFFSVPGQAITVNGEQVQVFEYPDAGSAAAAAARISPDGGTIGTTMVTWVGPPHFYRAGKVIVLYVGDSRAVISVLERVLGPQFAGR